MKMNKFFAAALSLCLIAGCSAPAADDKTQKESTDNPSSSSQTTEENESSVPQLLTDAANAQSLEDSLDSWQALLAKSIDVWNDDWSMDAETDVYAYDEQGKTNDENELMEINWESSFIKRDQSVYEIDLSERESKTSDFEGGYGVLNRYGPDKSVETLVALSAEPDKVLAGKVEDAQTVTDDAAQAMLSRLRLNCYEFGFGRQVSPFTTPDLYKAEIRQTAQGYDLVFELDDVQAARKKDLGSLPAADAAVPVISFESVEAETLTCHFTKNLELIGVDDAIVHGVISTNPGTPVTLIVKAETDGDEEESDFNNAALDQYFDSAISNQTFEIKDWND